MYIYLFPNQQFQNSGNVANGGAFRLYGSISDIYDCLVNGSFSSLGGFSNTNDNKARFAEAYQIFCCDADYNNDYVPSGWTWSIRPGVRLEINSGESAFYNEYFAGKHCRFVVSHLYSAPMPPQSVDEYMVEFDFVFPSYSSSVINIPNSGYYKHYSESTFDVCSSFSISSIAFYPDFNSGSLCSDSRSSGANQMIDIDIVGNFGGSPTTFSYSLGFPTPSVNAVNVEVSIPTAMRVKFDEFVSCDASFSGGVVRDDGILKVYGRLTGYGIGSVADTGIVDEEVLICQLSFSACCDDALTFSDFVSDYISNLMTDYTGFFGDIEVTKFVYSGFGALSDYCCDDIVCSDESFNFDDNSTIVDGDGGDDGGGDDGGDDGDGTDISCICDNLESLIDLLSDKFDTLSASVTSLATNLSAIASAVSNLDINNTSIATAINNKVIPVASVDTASIVSAINNKTIPVADNSGIVNSLGNINSDLLGIDGSLGQINTNIAGGSTILDGDLDNIGLILDALATAVGGVETAVENSATSVDGLTCTDSEGNEIGLACILKQALNSGDESLTDVVKDKDMSPFTDVTIEPYDFVNIRRAFNDDNLRE